jgi:hypothetical protein
MRLNMSISKGQKLFLFLFFAISIIIIGFIQYQEVLIKTIERVHSEFIIANINDYQKIEEDSIIYHYNDEIDIENIQEIASITQEMVNQVNKNFAQEKKEAFNVVIYPNSMEMNSGLRLSSQERTLGAYYGGNIFLLSPTQLNSSNTPIENIILHEYTHLLVEKRTKGYHPIWFTEGVALYQEYLITGYEWGENYDYNNIPYTIGQLQNDFYHLDTFKAYRSSFLRVRFITEIYGEEILLDIMNELGNGNSYEDSINNILGKNYKDLENNFMLWYESNFYDKL